MWLLLGGGPQWLVIRAIRYELREELSRARAEIAEHREKLAGL